MTLKNIQLLEEYNETPANTELYTTMIEHRETKMIPDRIKHWN